VQPIAIRYVDCQGERTDAAAYVGEISDAIGLAFDRAAATRRARTSMPPMRSARHRRELTREAESAIRMALG
jgi:hypothetical protein